MSELAAIESRMEKAIDRCESRFYEIGKVGLLFWTNIFRSVFAKYVKAQKAKEGAILEEAMKLESVAKSMAPSKERKEIFDRAAAIKGIISLCIVLATLLNADFTAVRGKDQTSRAKVVHVTRGREVYG